MDGIMEKLLVAIETLNSNVVLLTDATRKLADMQVIGRRHSSLADRTLETEQDMSRVFDELYDEDPDGKVSRADILAHFKVPKIYPSDKVIQFYDEWDKLIGRKYEPDEVDRFLAEEKDA